jgi:catechol 2,3-dioxygenase-like lactoylglutathione lyase family enzyme
MESQVGYEQYDFKRFDGGVIRIAGDHQEAVEWYCRHLQLEKGWHSPEDGMTGLCYPSGFAMSLENVKPGIEYASESNIRFCFETVNMEKTRSDLQQERVRVTEIFKSPGGLPIFDFYDLEGTRLTAVEARHELAAQLPESRFLFFYLWIGVRDFHTAAAWYEHHLKMDLIEKNDERRYAKLTSGKPHEFRGHLLQPWPVILEELPEEAFVGNTNSRIEPYFVPFHASQIVAAPNYFITRKIDTSGLFTAGNDPENSPFSEFYMYDPDGNRINFWFYGGE